MVSESIQLAIDARGVATVSLNKAEKHNAFDDAVIAELLMVFEELNNNPAVRVVVLAAKGKSFSAGADLGWMKRMANYSFDENLQDAQALAALFGRLNSMAKPTIARVQGAAFGGAVGLVSCCDIAIGTTRASFALSEAKIGLVPATISPYVVAVIGAKAAQRYFLTAERFDATTAHQLGLLNSVVEDDAAMDAEIDKLIGLLLANGPNAIKVSKQLVFDVSNKAIDADLVLHTSKAIAAARVSDEGQEGLSAFLERRPAEWVS